MPEKDWNLEVSEQAGMIEELRQQKAQRLKEDIAEELYHERRHAGNLCGICGLPESDHKGKFYTRKAGYCLYAPSSNEEYNYAYEHAFSADLIKARRER